MSSRSWAWRQTRQARIAQARNNNEPCTRCGQPIDYSLTGNHRWGPTIDHLNPLTLGGDETPPPELLAPAHRHCNTSHGAKLGNRLRPQRRNQRTKDATKPQGVPQPPERPKNASTGHRRPQEGGFPGQGAAPESHRWLVSPSIGPDRPGSAPTGPVADGVPDSDLDGHGHGWTDEQLRDVLPGLPARPESAGLPRFMTDPHPRAVGSLFDEFAGWARSRQGMHPKRSAARRWWQELVARRALEVDADGRLVWDTVVLSTPRQSGKSWLLRELALWRLGIAERVGESQTVLHAAMRLKHAHEVWYPAARWARERDEYVVRFANGEQRIEDRASGSVWQLAAATDGVGVSLSVSLALVDEAWGVGKELVDNAVVPTMAEAEQPQLWVVSTAGMPTRGERVTDLVPELRRSGADRGQAGVLLLEWSAPRWADVDDEGVWRSAAPHWDERRLGRVSSARARAGSGAQLEAFRRQWLNQWPQLTGKRVRGRLEPGVWDAAARQGVVPVPARRVVAVGHDRVAGTWVVCWAGRDESGVVVAGGVSVHGGLDAARAEAEQLVAAGGGVLLLPALLRGYVRVRGCRGQPVLLRESDVASAWEILQWRLTAGAIVQPDVDVMSQAVLSVPVDRRPGVWDAGTLLVCALWWAGREDAPRATVV